MTGVVILGDELDGKRVDVLHELAPETRRAAALLLPSSPNRASLEREMRAIAMRLGMQLLAFDASGPNDYPTAFAAMRVAGIQGVVITATPTFNRAAELLAGLGLELGVPTVCEWADNAR